MNKKIIINIVIFVVIIVSIIVGVVVVNNIKRKGPEEPVAVVIVDNEIIMEIDYLKLETEQDYFVTAIDKYTKEEHTITIGASDIGVWIKETFCRDRICVSTGVINANTIKPIVCMSFGLTIEIR